MNILLFANGSCQNHGCEAIRETTVELLGSKNQYYIGTTNSTYDSVRPNLELIPYSFKKTYTIMQRVLCRLKLMKNPKGKLHLDQFNDYFRRCDLAVSVGGDNYCYEDSDWLYYLHEMAVMHGKPSILWGASIEESLITDKMLDDFRKFDRIYVRESISYQSLLRRGIGNCYLCPDPAFDLMPKRPNHLQAGYFENKKYIGINISPLVERKEKESGLVFRNIRKIVRYILDNTECDILFVPHVVTPDNDDYELLKRYASALNSSRIVLLSDMDCDELKYYISRCEFFIAARTHASIAAYSTCVPTLVLGYSVKSRGIAQDLFGSIDDYVISVNQITDETVLMDKFLNLYGKRETVRAELLSKIPEYIKGLYEARDQILLKYEVISNE